MQVPTKIEDFHCTSVRTIHFHICDEPAACRTELRCLTLAGHLGAQGEEFVDTLLRFQGSRRLALAYVTSKVAVGDILGSLRGSCCFLQGALLNALILTLLFMRCRGYR